MTNECVLVVETELPIPFTCADGTGIAKGTVLKLADPATVSAASGLNDLVGGIAGSEKIASDGMVRVDVYRGGIFRGKASGSIVVGDSLGTTIGLNYLVKNNNTANLSGSKVLGTALESASDEETFLFELRPQVMNIE